MRIYCPSCGNKQYVQVNIPIQRQGNRLVWDFICYNCGIGVMIETKIHQKAKEK